jgi:hypothetical protein
MALHPQDPGLVTRHVPSASSEAQLHALEVSQLKNHVKYQEEQYQKLEDQLREAVCQLQGGDQDPKTCPDHPGHVLLMLGWEYIPDDPDEDVTNTNGCNWYDPQERHNGIRVHRCLTSALGVACRRLLDRLATPSWVERLDQS